MAMTLGHPIIRNNEFPFSSRLQREGGAGGVALRTATAHRGVVSHPPCENKIPITRPNRSNYDPMGLIDILSDT